MNKVAKRTLIVLIVLVVVFGIASFAYDRMTLKSTFTRGEDRTALLIPSFDKYAANHTRTPVEFQMNGQTLRGYVYEAKNPKGFVIFRHGIASTHATYLPMVMGLVDCNWTVMAYDALGCGESDGDSQLGMPQSALDVAAAVQFVRESGLAGDLPLVLWGHSWGGYGVSAALNLVDVDACVEMSGFDKPVEVIYEFTERMVGPLAITQYPTLWLNNVVDFGANANLSAVDGINKSDTPVLIIHGTKDATVEYDGSGITAQRDRITNPNVEYLILEEEGRNTHNGYFYTAESSAYLAERSVALSELRSQYPDGIPDEVLDEALADFDIMRANTPDPALIGAIDEFLTRVTGATMNATPAQNSYTLTSATYSNSGNSLGNIYAITAKYDEAGNVILVKEEKSQWSDPLTVREYKVPSDLMDRIADIAESSGMTTWGELPMSDLIVLDASTPAISLDYMPSNPKEDLPIWISYDRYTEFPEGGQEAFESIRDLLEGYATEENLIREYTKERE